MGWADRYTLAELVELFRQDELDARRAGYFDAADCLRNAADAIERGARPSPELYMLAGWRCCPLDARWEGRCHGSNATIP